MKRTPLHVCQVMRGEHLYAPAGTPALSLDEFRKAYPRQYGYYHKPFASRFTDGKGRPINPDRQRKSYNQAERKRDKIATEAYEQYVAIARRNGNVFPGDVVQVRDENQLELAV